MFTNRFTQPRWLGLLALLVTLGLVATTAESASAQQRDAVRDRAPTHTVEVLRLHCNIDVLNGERGVLCRWSQATNDRVRAYQLFRIVNGSARELIATTAPNGRQAHFDTNISAPSEVVYGVIALNRAGRVIGQSRPASLSIGSDQEVLRLACEPRALEGQRGVLCRWSDPQQATPRGFELYRAVDRDGRELIASIPADGRNAFFDTDTTPGSVHTYGVVAVNGQGRTVAVGGPSSVTWPAAD